MKLRTAGTWVEVAGAAKTDGIFTGYPQAFDSRIGTVNINTSYSIVNPIAVSVVDDPILGSSRKVAQLAVNNDRDTDPADPTHKVRVQLQTPFVFGKGHDIWTGFSVLFPVDFPVVPAAGWFAFFEIQGPPFAGGSPLAFTVTPLTDLMQWGIDPKWTKPMVRGAWQDFALHVRLAPTNNDGFVELWHNGGAGWAQQTFDDLTTRRYYKTLDTPNADGWNAVNPKHYRQRGMAGFTGTVTTYLAEHRIGSSFADVAPHSY